MHCIDKALVIKAGIPSLRTSTQSPFAIAVLAALRSGWSYPWALRVRLCELLLRGVFEVHALTSCRQCSGCSAVPAIAKHQSLCVAMAYDQNFCAERVSHVCVILLTPRDDGSHQLLYVTTRISHPVTSD